MPFPILLLPTEPRLLIYTHLPITILHHPITTPITMPTTIPYSAIPTSPYSLQTLPETTILLTTSLLGISLLATCRQIYNEAAPILIPLRDYIATTNAKIMVMERMWRSGWVMDVLGDVMRASGEGLEMGMRMGRLEWGKDDTKGIVKFWRKHGDVFLTPAVVLREFDALSYEGAGTGTGNGPDNGTVTGRGIDLGMGRWGICTPHLQIVILRELDVRLEPWYWWDMNSGYQHARVGSRVRRGVEVVLHGVWEGEVEEGEWEDDGGVGR